MAITRDIAATYRGPRRVVEDLLTLGKREDRALAYLMGACLLFFIARMPALARQAHETGQELDMLMGGTLLAWLFIAPLILYLIAGLVRLVARLLGGKGTAYGARLALFWALLASTPLILLHGLVAGFIGPGPGLQIVGLLWFGVFMWFWISGMLASEKGTV
ncbi:MAG: YIP1 family protein [Pseudomonadota bacterium]